MPSSIANIPFNPLVAEDLVRNCVHVQAVSAQIGSNSSSPIDRLDFTDWRHYGSGTPMDLGSNHAVPFKYSTLSYLNSNNFPARFSDHEPHLSIADRSNVGGTYQRVGREGSALYMWLPDYIATNNTIIGFAFTQRTIGSRQKRPSWQLSAAYNTRCTNASLDYYDEGTSAWVNGDNINVNTNSVTPRLIATPFSGHNLIRLRCIDGPINNGFQLVSGDPHFSLSGLNIISDTPAQSFPSVGWALCSFKPSDYSSFSLDSLENEGIIYVGENQGHPLFMCDVGGVGSNRTIELQFNPVAGNELPVISKMRLNVED